MRSSIGVVLAFALGSAAVLAACSGSSTSAGNGASPSDPGGSGTTSGGDPATTPDAATKDGGGDVDAPSAPCIGSACAPVALATGQETPSGIAASGGYVYWTTLAGQLRRAPSGGGSVEDLASVPLGADSLVVADSSVFWLGTADGPDGLGYFESIYKTPLTGGSAAVVVSIGEDKMANGLQLLNGTFYWGDFSAGGIFHAPQTGGAPVSQAPASGPRALAVDATNVYWVDYDGKKVMRASLGGGSPVTLAPNENGPSRICLDHTTLYFGNFDGGEIRSVQTDGTGLKTVAASQDGPGGIAVHDGTVYWTAQADGGVVRKLVPGAAAPTDIATGQGFPAFATTDGTYVYWVVEGDEGKGNGQIMRAGL